MKILIGCEEFGEVRDAFIAYGENAVSCDLEPTRKPGPHLQRDVLEVIPLGWDLVIIFPPCTYLSSSGLHWNTKNAVRAQKTEDALHFVSVIMNLIRQYSKHGGWLENPLGCISTRIWWNEDDKEYQVLPFPNPKFAYKWTQMIQPYQFGHDASKATYLWRIPGYSLEPGPWDNLLTHTHTT